MSTTNRPGSLARLTAIAALTLTACAVRVQSAPPELPPPPVAVRGGAGVAVEETTAIDSTGEAYADTDPSALLSFRAELSGHGDWVEDDAYGTVWIPTVNEVGVDFVPYASAGHWVYDTDYVWVSDYPWGWVTFHYGRWILIGDRGWAWVPGRQYADAWVVWRVGEDSDFDYVGWAPAPPAWIWRWGVAVAIGVPPPAPFVYCRRPELFQPTLGARVVRGAPAWIERRTRTYGPAYHPDIRQPLALQAPHGPPPATLRIAPAAVPRAQRADPGLSTARQLARPATAQALGARAPTPHFVQPKPVSPRVLQGVTAPQPPSPPKVVPRPSPKPSPKPLRLPPAVVPHR